LGNDWFLGIVENERFVHVASDAHAVGSYRLTQSDRNAAPPEVGELALGSYEGSAVMVRGIVGNGWIYSATVVEQAGPILTVLVARLRESDS
jgi:hypothetical protein